MAKRKMQSSNERFDKAKWWFSCDGEEENKFYVERNSGRAMSKGERLNQITNIRYSLNRSTILKVK